MYELIPHPVSCNPLTYVSSLRGSAVGHCHDPLSVVHLFGGAGFRLCS